MTHVDAINRTLRWGKGYAGKLGKRCWVARITGTESQYGFSRDFLSAEKVERAHFNRSRTIVNFSYALTPGLYELCAESEHWYLIVWTKKDGEIKAFRPDEIRVAAIAALLGAGEDFDSARRATRGESANAKTA